MKVFRRSAFALSTAFLALLPIATPVHAQARSVFPPLAAQNSRFDSTVTLQGTVVRRRDNNEFDLRVGGATFRVRSPYNVPVQEGDRITLRGTFQNNDSFDAQSVRVLETDPNNDGSYGNGGYGNGGNGTGDYQGNVDFPAVLTRIFSRREVEVRGDNNRVYRVTLQSDTSALRVGLRLRVRGVSSGPARIIEGRLIFGGTGSSGGYDTGNTARTVDFPARIIRIDTLRDQATVRGENGRDYVIHGQEVDAFRSGDRVRVRGEASANLIELGRLDLLP